MAPTHYRRLIALLMVCAYLILPLDSFANLEHPFGGFSHSDSTLHSDSPQSEIASLDAPASHCPCSDRHGSDGCNPSCSCCSCCSFFAPIPAEMGWLALQPGTTFSMLEPFKHFPEVYLPIFVPPQNLS
jgi:hypothetical protein